MLFTSLCRCNNNVAGKWHAQQRTADGTDKRERTEPTRNQSVLEQHKVNVDTQRFRLLTSLDRCNRNRHTVGTWGANRRQSVKPTTQLKIDEHGQSRTTGSQRE
eukprot:1266231-Pleurochrysis_carterae.AAC.1